MRKLLASGCPAVTNWPPHDPLHRPRDGGGVSLSPAIANLVEALARQDAEDYLREAARQDGAAGDQQQNHGLPATDRAA